MTLGGLRFRGGKRDAHEAERWGSSENAIAHDELLSLTQGTPHLDFGDLDMKKRTPIQISRDKLLDVAAGTAN